MRSSYEAIVALTDAFARERLNGEYGDLLRRLTATIARKRPSPLSRGKPATWAAGIVHALGMVNFLFDPSQQPHVRASEVYERFGVSESAGSGKSRSIRKLLQIHELDPRWTLPSELSDNPLAWLVQVNGVLLDARDLSRELQELAHQEGLIPYVPEDSRGSRDEQEG